VNEPVKLMMMIWSVSTNCCDFRSFY